MALRQTEDKLRTLRQQVNDNRCAGLELYKGLKHSTSKQETPAVSATATARQTAGVSTGGKIEMVGSTTAEMEEPIATTTPSEVLQKTSLTERKLAAQV